MKVWQYFHSQDKGWTDSIWLNDGFDTFTVKDVQQNYTTREICEIGPNMWFVCKSNIIYRIVEKDKL